MATASRQSRPQLPEDDEIVNACIQQSAVQDNCYGTLVYPSLDAPIAFIKYGPEQCGMMAQMRTQTYAWNALKQIPQQKRDVQIPEIYHVIQRDEITYIIMEYVQGETLEELLAKNTLDDCQKEYSQISKAMKTLLSIEVPKGCAPGPIGSGLIRHPLFKGAVASTEYDSVHELQQHINNVCSSQNLASMQC